MAGNLYITGWKNTRRNTKAFYFMPNLKHTYTYIFIYIDISIHIYTQYRYTVYKNVHTYILIDMLIVTKT